MTESSPTITAVDQQACEAPVLRPMFTRDGDTEKRASPTKVRRKVEHLFWLHHREAARELDLAVVSLCGRYTQRPMPLRHQSIIPVVGDLFPLLNNRDCLHCGRVLSNYHRDDFEANREARGHRRTPRR
jgi:hypothetical protein